LLALVAWVGLTPTPVRAATRADRDGDKVYDSLESELSGDRAVPVVVSLRGSADAQGVARAVGETRKLRRIDLVHAFATRATPAEVRALAERSDVAHVEPDDPVVPFGVTAQTSFGVTQARTELAGLDGHGEVAAVIDSGIDPTWPDLAGGKVIAFQDLVNGRNDPYDDLGHGSLVSSILAGSGAGAPEGRGVAPAAALVGVKVIDGNAQSSLSLIAQGIQWAVDNQERYGIDAINLSIGDPNGCGDGTDVASRAVDAAVAQGIVVVTAAGNSGPANCTIKSPAAADSALTVGAMADTGAGGFSEGWFSSRGPTADGRIKPDISAPGVNVVMPAIGGGYGPQSGTSAAAPFVTGAALLMLEENPQLTPRQIKDAMRSTAGEPPASTWSTAPAAWTCMPLCTQPGRRSPRRPRSPRIRAGAASLRRGRATRTRSR
jgi:serine protease AprX